MRFAVEILLKSAGGPKVKSEFDGIGAGARGAAGEVSKLDVSIGGIGRNLASLVGGFVSLQAVMASVSAIVRTAASYEQLRLQLETVTGSAETAAAAFDMVKKFATATPFEVDKITTAFIQLAAVGIKPTESLLTSIGDTAAAFGRDITDYAQAVIRATTGEMEMLKGFGIVAKVQGDKVTFLFKGVTTEVQRNQKAIVDYLESIGKTQFAGGMERQANSLKGAFSNLQDAFAGFADALGQSGLTEGLATALRFITKLLVWNTDHWAEWQYAAVVAMGDVSVALADVAVGALRTMEVLARLTSYAADVQQYNPFATRTQKEAAAALATLTIATLSNLRREAEQVASDLNSGFADKADAALARVGQASKDLNLDFMDLGNSAEKLSEKALKALMDVEKTIAALERAAQNAEKLYRARLTGGEKGEKAEEIRQKAAEKILDLNEKLAEAQKGLGLSQKQIDRIREAVTSTAEWNDATKEVEAAEKKVVAAIVASGKAMADWMNAGREREAAVKKQAKEVAADIARVRVEIEALQQGRGLRGLDLERMLGAKDVERGVLQITAAIEQLGGESEEAFKVRLAGAAKEARAALTELANERLFDLQVEKILTDFRAVVSGFEGLASDIGSALGEAFTTGRLEWGKLADSMKQTMANTIADIVSDFLSQWIRAIAQWLARWIASHRVAQVTAAQTAAVNAAAGNAGVAAGKGVTGGFTTLGMTGGQAALRAGSGGASAWSTYGTYASYAFLAWVGYNIYKGWTKKRATFGELSIDNVAAGSSKISDKLREVLADVRAGLAEITKQWRLGIEQLGSVSIGVTSRGVIYVKTAIDAVGQVFKTMEEAVEFAKVQALKLAQFSKETSALVQAAIRGSRATTLEGLGSDIDFARMIEGLGLPEVARQIMEFTQTAVDNFRRAMDLFSGDLSQAAVAVGAIMTDLGSNLWTLYNRLQGIKEDPKAAWEREKAAFNARLAITRAQIILIYEEIKARIAAYMVHRATVFGGGRGIAGGGGTEGGDVSRGGEGGSGGQRGAGKGGWNPNEPRPDVRNPGNDPQLAALLQILDELARALAGLPPAIEGGYPGARGGGRGGARADARRSALDQLEDMRARAAGEYTQILLERTRAEREWAETVKEGKLTTTEAAEGERLLRAERAQAIAEFRKGLFGDVASFVGVSPFAAVKADADALRDRLRDALKEGAIKWREFRAEMDKLNAAERERLHILEQESIAGVAEGFAKYVTDATLKTKLLQEAAIIRFEIEYAQLLAQVELLREQGRNVDLLDQAVRNIGDNLPKVLQTIRDNVSDLKQLFPDDYAILGPNGERPNLSDDPIKRARDMLKEWQDLGLHPLTKDLRDLGEDFAFLKKTLGDTAEVQAAYAAKLKDILSRYIDPIREFREGRQLSGLSTLTGEGKFYESQKQFREALAAIQGGDLTKLDDILALAQTYGEQGQAFTAGSGLRFIMKEIDDALLRLEQTVPDIAAGAPLGSPTNPMMIQLAPMLGAIETQTDTLNTGNVLMLDELRRSNTTQEKQASLLADISEQLANPLRNKVA